MKDNPLVKALKDRSKPKMEPYPVMEPSRSFDFMHSDSPKLADAKVGDKMTIQLHGHVKSQHDDGRGVMHVDRVTHGEQSSEYKTTEPKEKPIYVTTQQSHA